MRANSREHVFLILRHAVDSKTGKAGFIHFMFMREGERETKREIALSLIFSKIWQMNVPNFVPYFLEN